jgi:hypothetical protein
MERSVTGTRWMLAVLAALVVTLPADAGSIFGRKGKSDARVRQLVDTLRTDPDEKKRRAAAVELREADPRTQAEVIPALVAALQRDPAAGVRADAAETIGQFKYVFPLAGLALEAAAEGDASADVRDLAQQALWEYHLSGYRSVKGADGIAGQTPEPPLARPEPARPAAVLLPPAVAPVIQPVSVSPPPPVAPVLPAVTPRPVTAFRPTAPAADAPKERGPRVVFTAAPPFQLNVTAEPPRAKPLPVAPPPTPVFVLPPPDLEIPARAPIVTPDGIFPSFPPPPAPPAPRLPAGLPPLPTIPVAPTM